MGKQIPSMKPTCIFGSLSFFALSIITYNLSIQNIYIKYNETFVSLRFLSQSIIRVHVNLILKLFRSLVTSNMNNLLQNIKCIFISLYKNIAFWPIFNLVYMISFGKVVDPINSMKTPILSAIIINIELN